MFEKDKKEVGSTESSTKANSSCSSNPFLLEDEMESKSTRRIQRQETTVIKLYKQLQQLENQVHKLHQENGEDQEVRSDSIN